MLSKDETKTRNAIKAINAMDTIDAVKAYIEGEDRTDVLDAAQVQIEFIQGPGKEQGPGSGVQGTEGQGSESGIQGSAVSPLPSEGEGQGEGADSKSDKDTLIPQSEIRDPQLKQGETGPITQHADEFKGPGVQGTKASVASPLVGEVGEGADSKSDKNPQSKEQADTKSEDSKTPNSEIRNPKLPLMGQDIIEDLDKADLKKVNELALKAAPADEAAKKSESEIRQSKGVVTCEDVLARMRREGKAV